jgi:hypothetical protein
MFEREAANASFGEPRRFLQLFCPTPGTEHVHAQRNQPKSYAASDPRSCSGDQSRAATEEPLTQHVTFARSD